MTCFYVIMCINYIVCLMNKTINPVYSIQYIWLHVCTSTHSALKHKNSKNCFITSGDGPWIIIFPSFVIIFFGTLFLLRFFLEWPWLLHRYYITKTYSMLIYLALFLTIKFCLYPRIIRNNSHYLTSTKYGQ